MKTGRWCSTSRPPTNILPIWLRLLGLASNVLPHFFGLWMRAAACGVPCVKKASSTNSPPRYVVDASGHHRAVLRQTGRGHRPGGLESESRRNSRTRAQNRPGLFYSSVPSSVRQVTVGFFRLGPDRCAWTSGSFVLIPTSLRRLPPLCAIQAARRRLTLGTGVGR